MLHIIIYFVYKLTAKHPRITNYLTRYTRKYLHFANFTVAETQQPKSLPFDEQKTATWINEKIATTSALPVVMQSAFFELTVTVTQIANNWKEMNQLTVTVMHKI